MAWIYCFPSSRLNFLWKPILKSTRISASTTLLYQRTILYYKWVFKLVTFSWFDRSWLFCSFLKPYCVMYWWPVSFSLCSIWASWTCMLWPAPTLGAEHKSSAWLCWEAMPSSGTASARPACSNCRPLSRASALSITGWLLWAPWDNPPLQLRKLFLLPASVSTGS